jgi:hypothetical protein
LDETTIQKYIKVKALALQGSPGEKENAQRICARMELEHPGIAGAAERYVRAKMATPEGQAAAADARRRKTGGPAPRDTGNWETIFRYAQMAFDGVFGVAETLSDAQRGVALGEAVEAEWRNGKNETLLMVMRLTPHIFESAARLNAMQKVAFRQVMHRHLDRLLDDILGKVNGP